MEPEHSHRVYMMPALDPLLRHMHPVYILRAYDFKNHFNIILPHRYS